jgi:hypothetical protein
VEKNWDRFFEGPLRNIVEVDLSLIAFTEIAGKFAISSMEVNLNSSSSLVVFELQGKARKM